MRVGGGIVKRSTSVVPPKFPAQHTKYRRNGVLNVPELLAVSNDTLKRNQLGQVGGPIRRQVVVSVLPNERPFATGLGHMLSADCCRAAGDGRNPHELYDTKVGPNTLTTDRTHEVPFTNNTVPCPATLYFFEGTKPVPGVIAIRQNHLHGSGAGQ